MLVGAHGACAVWPDRRRDRPQGAPARGRLLGRAHHILRPPCETLFHIHIYYINM